MGIRKWQKFLQLSDKALAFFPLILSSPNCWIMVEIVLSFASVIISSDGGTAPQNVFFPKMKNYLRCTGQKRKSRKLM